MFDLNDITMPSDEPDLLLDYVNIGRLTEKLLDLADQLREARNKLHEKATAGIDFTVLKPKRERKKPK